MYLELPAMLAPPALNFCNVAPPWFILPADAAVPRIRRHSLCSLTQVLEPRGPRVRRTPRLEHERRITRIPTGLSDDSDDWRAQDLVDCFFRDAPEARAKGTSLRLQVASVSMTILIYAMIVRRALQIDPSGRCVIFVRRASVARRVLDKLKGHGLQAAMVAQRSRMRDLRSQVVVCLCASAHRLRGHHFIVKLWDSALQPTHSETARIVCNAVSASMSAEFSLQSEAADLSYTFAQAVEDGRARNFEPYFLPVPGKNSGCAELLNTLKALQVQMQSETSIMTADVGFPSTLVNRYRFACPFSPGLSDILQLVPEVDSWAPVLVVLNTARQALEFARELQQLEVPAAAVSGKLGSWQKSSALQGVQQGDVKVLCVSHWIFERSDLPAFGTVLLAQANFTKPSTREGLLRALQPTESGCSDSALKPLKLVCVVGESELLYRPLRIHRAMHFLGSLWGPRKPSTYQVLNVEGSTISTTARALWPRGWLESLCVWVQSTRRPPSCTREEERLLAHRWQQAKKLLRADRLNAVEKERVETCLSLLGDRSQIRLEDLCSWMSTHKRHPYQRSKDPIERRQSLRLSRTRKRLREGKLSFAQAALFERALQQTVRPWLRTLVAWLRFFERLPHMHAEEHEERVQNRRWKEATRNMKPGLTEAERQLLMQCLSWKLELSARPRFWLVSLWIWTSLHQRRPRDSKQRDAEERLQAMRWKKAFQQLSNGDLTESEASLLTDCLQIVDQHSA